MPPQQLIKQLLYERITFSLIPPYFFERTQECITLSFSVSMKAVVGFGEMVKGMKVTIDPMLIK